MLVIGSIVGASWTADQRYEWPPIARRRTNSSGYLHLIASSVLIREPSYCCGMHAFPKQYRSNTVPWRIEIADLAGG